MAAMRAHATQITVDGPFFALSNNLGNAGVGPRVLPARPGPPGTERDADGRETDLFAGLDEATRCDGVTQRDRGFTGSAPNGWCRARNRVILRGRPVPGVRFEGETACRWSSARAGDRHADARR